MNLLPDTLTSRLPDPDTAAGRIAHHAAIEHLKGLLDDARTQVRARLEADLDAVEALTGATANVPSDWGRAYRTNPQPKPTITDRDALAGWMAANTPDLVSTVRTVRNPDPRSLAVLVDELHAARRAGDGLALETAADDLIEWAAVGDRTLLPDDPVAALGDAVRVTDGGVVWRDSGELLPGVEVSTARRQFVVRHDKGDRRRVADEFDRARAALTDSGPY